MEIKTNTLYKKVGKRYVPIKEYSKEFNNDLDSLAHGSWLVFSQPGSMRYHRVDPAIAPMVAAGLYAIDSITKKIVEASTARPSRQPITKEQHDAWRNLESAFGGELCMLQHSSAAECAEAGVHALVAEASRLLENPAVKHAYEHFLLTCKLTQEQETP